LSFRINNICIILLQPENAEMRRDADEMEKAQKPKTYHSQTDERLINSPEN
jgi:hypothetical protein